MFSVCGMVHIKEPLLLIDKSSLCGVSGFPFSLSERSFTIYPTPYNRKQNVLSALLNKTFPSFLHGGLIELFVVPFTYTFSQLSFIVLKKTFCWKFVYCIVMSY